MPFIKWLCAPRPMPSWPIPACYALQTLTNEIYLIQSYTSKKHMQTDVYLIHQVSVSR